jgi:hypothetical protein
MPLQFPSPPDQSYQAAVAGLRQTRPSAGGFALGGAPVRVANALQVFTLTRHAAASGQGLNSASAEAWRYLVDQPQDLSGGGSPASIPVAEVLETAGGHRFSHRQEGWLGRRTKEVIDSLANLPQVQSGSFEVRMLRIPSVDHIDALWLKSDGSGDDLIVPIASTSQELPTGSPLTAETFLDVLRRLADKPTFDNSPRTVERSGAQ